MPREALAALQFERLRSSLRNAWDNVPLHRQRMQVAGIVPEEVRSLDDLRRVPFTFKSDLRDHYPYGMFARPVSGLARLHASSGTTGKATVVGYTRADIDNWANLMARSLHGAGARAGDVVHNAYGYGLFTGGLGAHYGAERLGGAVVPMSGGSTERQIALIMDLGARVLCATPSYALAMAEVAEQLGVDLRQSKLEVGVFGAEPWSAAMRAEIEERLGLKAVDIYGLSEIMGPGVACECTAQAGLHGWEDHFLFEVLDPETQAPVPEGQAGELVITTLTKEALPMLRYRTRDITKLTTTPCECGRTHLRILRITGRSDDMLIIRGVNVYPSQIEAVLVGRPMIAPHYQLVVERQGTLDQVTIEVEAQAGVAPEAFAAIARDVAHHVKSMVGISASVLVKPVGEIPRSQGKAVRVRDLRPKE
ncbi:phenylacetate--CoA ligase family protein [Rhodoferax sp.]|uniref:phenylacetate--CoA ligase family protein n=1 Tax=Rhodoferax sp. TaxID=50421 RepID=UPI002746BC83|nr:phenylacetate--CoA ligase [Rhodoferax sp.]